MRQSEAPGPRQAADSLLYLCTKRGERNHKECGAYCLAYADCDPKTALLRSSLRVPVSYSH